MITIKIEISSTSHPKYERVVLKTSQIDFDPEDVIGGVKDYKAIFGVNTLAAAKLNGDLIGIEDVTVIPRFRLTNLEKIKKNLNLPEGDLHL